MTSLKSTKKLAIQKQQFTPFENKVHPQKGINLLGRNIAQLFSDQRPVTKCTQLAHDLYPIEAQIHLPLRNSTC